MVDRLLADFGYAVRSLRRRPASVVPIVVILGLGIAGCTLFTGLAIDVFAAKDVYSSPKQLVTIWNRYGEQTTPLSPPDYLDYQAAESFTTIAAATTSSVALGIEGQAGTSQPRQLTAGLVTDRFFDTLGVQALHGRPVFSMNASESRPVVVLSFSLWTQAFGGDPGIIGKSIEIDRRSTLVQAVMPPRLEQPVGADLWLPLQFEPTQTSDSNRGNEYLEVIARLAPSLSLEQAQTEADAIAASVIERVPDRADYLSNNGWGAQLTSFDAHLFGKVRGAVWLLVGTTVLLLLIACANAGNLLLARTVSRRPEMSMRACLGATRSHIARQLVFESGILALAAGLLGLLVALFASAIASSWLPNELLGSRNLTFDGRTISFTLAMVAMTTLAFGVTPAWRAASRATKPVASRLGTKSSNKARRILVVQEIALTSILLLGAGVLLLAFRHLTDLPLGFATEGRTTFRVSLPNSHYPERQERLQFASQLEDSLKGLPGVKDIAAADRLPLDGQIWGSSFHPEGRDTRNGNQTPGAELNVVTRDYFSTLEINLLAGRTFSRNESGSLPTVVIDQVTQERYWPNGALGKRLTFDRDAEPIVWREIVGVASHVRQESLTGQSRPQIYVPNNRGGLRGMTFVLHSEAGEELGRQIREAVASLDPSLPVFEMRSMSNLYAGHLSLPRFQAWFVAALAASSLFYCLVGVYGILSHSVAQRRSEIGLRLALGATGKRLIVQILSEALTLSAFGLAAGTAIGLPLILLTRSKLGELPADVPLIPVLASVVGLCLAATALIAVLPARQAATTDPAISLRQDSL